jgi:dolichyl-phosphate beta-glucosyltransferase
MTNRNPYLSIIIPSYKSSGPLEKNLPVLLHFLNKKKFTWEVLVVDDGSQDKGKTEAIVRKLNCRFLKNSANMGKGGALRNGMLNAKGFLRIFTDADIPYQTEVLDQFIHELDSNEYDMTVGDRTLNTNYYTTVSRLRKIASRTFSSLVGMIITTGNYDTQCGIKGFRGDCAEDIFSVATINGFAIDVEVFYIALKRKYKIKKIPVALRSQDGKSVNVFKHGLLMLMDIPLIISNHYQGKYKVANVKPETTEEFSPKLSKIN